VVEIWSGIALRTRGVEASLAGALSYAVYILLAEHAVATRDPISLSCYGFFFASLFWAAVQPWSSFPDGVVGRTTSPHGHLASPAATLVVFLWLGESPGLLQLLGGGIVLAAVGPAQSSR